MAVSSTSLGKTLRPLPASLRSKARQLYRERTSGRFDRASLEQSLFELQEEIEWRPTYQASSDGYQRMKPVVELVNAVRNVLLDDLGVNEGERLGGRCPHVERVANVMREKRRQGGPGFRPRVGEVA